MASANAHRYNKVTLKNATDLTVDVNYPLDNEVAFQNPQTSQNGLSNARKNSASQVFKSVFIEVIGGAGCSSAEFVFNKDQDNMVIVQKGGSRVIEFSDEMEITSVDVIPRGANAVTADIVVELRGRGIICM